MFSMGAGAILVIIWGLARLAGGVLLGRSSRRRGRGRWLLDVCLRWHGERTGSGRAGWRGRARRGEPSCGAKLRCGLGGGGSGGGGGKTRKTRPSSSVVARCHGGGGRDEIVLVSSGDRPSVRRCMRLAVPAAIGMSGTSSRLPMRVLAHRRLRRTRSQCLSQCPR